MIKLNRWRTSQTEYLDRISSKVDLISVSCDIVVVLRISGWVGSARETEIGINSTLRGSVAVLGDEEKEYDVETIQTEWQRPSEFGYQQMVLPAGY